jgi:hypothetical protein
MNQGEANGKQVISQAYWREMTSALYPATKPRTATPYFGYGYQLWLDPANGVFCMRGLKGQAVYVDVAQRLVMVRLAVAKFGDRDDSPERDQLWQSVRSWAMGASNASTGAKFNARKTETFTQSKHSPVPVEKLSEEPLEPVDFGNDRRTDELLEELSRQRR